MPFTTAHRDQRTVTAKSDVLQQALTWQVTFWSNEVTGDERAAFEHWLAADTRHAAAWEQIRSTDARLAAMASPGAAPAIRASQLATARRKQLRLLGWFVGAGLVAYGARQTPQWKNLAADYRTATGERRQVTLPDGTRITLDTGSAIDVAFDDTRRLVHLRGGAILVATAPDTIRHGRPPRPLMINTAQGTVRPVGTRFTVRQNDVTAAVAVLEGAVELMPHSYGAGARPRRLEAGQQTSMTAHAVADIVALPAVPAAWTQGRMIAGRMRLADFVAELARYRRGVLRCDPAVANLRVSGVFSLDDTDDTLAALAAALPVRIDHISRFWVTVRPRQ